MKPELSVVMPVYNEEANLEELYRRLTAVLGGVTEAYELVFVDDGSGDASWATIARLAAVDARVRGLRFSRNFGHQMAFTAGVDHARGDVVVIMDSDLQDPPELIPDLIARHREGFEVAYAVRANRAGETAFKRLSAALFYRFLRSVTRVEIPLDTGDFRLMGPRAVAAFRSLREHGRFTRGMVAWLGFTQTGVPFDRPPRRAGRSNYPLRSMLRLATDAFTSFSLVPLQLASWLGLLLVAGSVGLIVLRLAGAPAPPHALLLAALGLLGGAQLLAIGLLGSYLGRIYDEVRQRPLYIVRESIGGDPAGA